jgi:hypothetical protein
MMLHILFTLFSTLCQIIPLAGPTMVYGGGTVSTPVDSPGTGTYSSAQTITITSTNSTSIYYTVDGSTPACPSTGTLYSGGFTSPSSTFTLKAIGCRTGWTSSGIDTSNYTISGGSTKTVIAHEYAPLSGGSPISTVGANTLVVAEVIYGVSTSAVYPADLIGGVASGNTWVQCGSDNVSAANSSFHIGIWYAASANVGANHTFPANTIPGYSYFYVVAYSNGSASPCDTAATAFNAGGGSPANSLSTGSVTPATSGELVLTFPLCYQGTAASTNTINGGFTAVDAGYLSGPLWSSTGYLIQTAATAANPTWNNSAGSGTPFYGALIQGFK